MAGEVVIVARDVFEGKDRKDSSSGQENTWTVFNVCQLRMSSRNFLADGSCTLPYRVLHLYFWGKQVDQQHDVFLQIAFQDAVINTSWRAAWPQ